MTTVKEWCEHIRKSGDGFWIWDHNTTGGMGGIALAEHMNFCSRCGKPRPEEPKALWECISGGGVSSSGSQETVDNLHKAFSLSAIKWFNERLPDHNCDFPMCGEYKQYIHIWLGKEKERCE